MIPPAEAANEAERLRSLRTLNILDTLPEERFDRLTRLARRLFGVPIALVSLVDANRQWFKSCDGLATKETPRDISFCGHAILSGEILMIPDALLDERFHDNPLVVGEPGVRFHAGCPLIGPNGSRLGTLCLIDREPRRLDDNDLELLRDLADMAEQELAAVQMASCDELTQLSNRRGFVAMAQHTLSLSARLGQHATLHLFDLDDFKRVNDRYGHAEGDRALLAFATLLKQAFRASDVVGRLGGDEFVALEINAPPGQGSSAAVERLRQALAHHNRSSPQGSDLCCSAGQVAYEPTRHRTVDMLLAQADGLMYQNKRRSRKT